MQYMCPEFPTNTQDSIAKIDPNDILPGNWQLKDSTDGTRTNIVYLKEFFPEIHCFILKNMNVQGKTIEMRAKTVGKVKLN